MFKILTLSVVIFAILRLSAAWALDPVNMGYFNNVTIDGYDATAYFQQGKAVEGQEHYRYTWKGAEWHFVREEDRDLFAATPESYAPQYGGYCSNQMSLGNLSDTDAEVWLIHGGKLYLFGHDVGRDRWMAGDLDVFVEQANAHWQRMLAAE